MDRIAKAFDNKKALVVYVSCGCPNLETSEKAIEIAIESGASIIELGVPFSDPMADGVVIQMASQKALENKTRLEDILEMAKRIRSRHSDVVLLLFSYYNIIFKYGIEKLAKRLKEIEIDAVLPVDLPYEEREELSSVFDNYGIKIVPLISPLTPEERVKKIVEQANAFIYYVTVCGVTGERGELPIELQERLAMVKKHSPVPVVAGFGISNGETAKMISKYADGIVVGSAIVRPLLELDANKSLKVVEELTKELYSSIV